MSATFLQEVNRVCGTAGHIPEFTKNDDHTVTFIQTLDLTSYI